MPKQLKFLANITQQINKSGPEARSLDLQASLLPNLSWIFLGCQSPLRLYFFPPVMQLFLGLERCSSSLAYPDDNLADYTQLQKKQLLHTIMKFTCFCLRGNKEFKLQILIIIFAIQYSFISSLLLDKSCMMLDKYYMILLICGI